MSSSRSGLGTGTPGLSVAEAALQGGAGQVALQVSESILRERPDDMAAREIKGDALTLLGQYDEATAVFQSVLAKNPNSLRANTGLGRIRLASDPAAAEILFQQILKRDARDQTALKDPWSRPLVYMPASDGHTFSVESLGADGKLGGSGLDRALRSPAAETP